MLNKLLVLLIAAGLVVAGYLVYERLDIEPVVEAPPTPTPTPTPAPTPTPEPTPEPEAVYAPEGILFVVQRFAEEHEAGVHAFSPGMEVRLVGQEAGYYIVADGEVLSRRPRSWFTREIALARALREERELQADELQARLAQERAQYEVQQKERAARWEAALARVEEARQAARETAVALPGLQPLRIGAWNLEHFGRRNDPPRKDEDVQAVADYIRELDVQVLAVSEINGAKPLQDLVRRIGPDWKFVVGTSGSLGPDGQIAPGVLWDDSKVELITAGELSELQTRLSEGLVFHRIPVTACFRCRAGGPDFRVISVHLKAGRSPEDFQRREGELKALRDYLGKLVADPDEDNDIVVLGDFNHSHTAPKAEILTNGAFANFLADRQASQSIIHFDRQIDHIVPLGSFEEIDTRSFRVHNEGLRNKEAWRNRYSDHFPVTATLEAIQDDDPQSKFTPPPARLR